MDSESFASPQSATEVKTPPTVGFSTGRGKKIAVSEEAMRKAKAMFDDSDDATPTPLPIPVAEAAVAIAAPPPVGGGFETGRGKKIAVSEEEAIQRAKRLFDDDDDGTSSQPREEQRIPATVGFATGRGKKIVVSEEAIQKAKSLFDDSTPPTDFTSDATAPQPPIPLVGGGRGFQTGRGKDIAVSDEAMQRAKMLFDDSPSPTDFTSDATTPQPPIPLAGSGGGFATGRGKAIAVSEEAIRRARMLFDSDGDDETEVCSEKKRKHEGEHRSPSKKRPGATHNVDVETDSGSIDEDAEILEALDSSQQSRTAEGPLLTPSAVADLVQGIDIDAEFPLPPSTPPQQQPQQQQSHLSQPAPTSLVSILSTPPAAQTKLRYPAPVPVPVPKSAPPRVRGSRLGTRGSDGGKLPVTPLASKTASALRNRAAQSPSPVAISKKPFSPPTISKVASNPPPTKDIVDVPTAPQKPHRDTVPLRSLVSGYDGSSLSLQDLYKEGVLAELVTLNSRTAADFRFRFADLNEPADGIVPLDGATIGPEDMLAAMKATVASAKPDLLKLDWVRNHWRWVVWKLAAMERCFPRRCGGVCLTPKRVLEQLCHRYDRENNMAQRSAIRRIYERDGVPSRLLVACVASISFATVTASAQAQSAKTKEEKDGGADSTETGKSQERVVATLELTDGWYSIKATVDDKLCQMIFTGKLYEGQKLRIFGAKRTGDEGGVSPLENPDAVGLSIQINGTRRAKWDARLGFQKQRTFSTKLSTIKQDGGTVPAIDVVVLRKYPLLFVETVEERKIIRSEREEEEATKSRDAKLMQEFEVHGAAAMEQDGFMDQQRDIMPILRLRVKECPEFVATAADGEIGNNDGKSEAIMSVLSPAGDLVESVQEGAWVRFFMVGVGKRPPALTLARSPSLIPLQLTANGSSPWAFIPPSERATVGPANVPRRVFRIDQLQQRVPGQEFDFVGIVIGVGEKQLDSVSRQPAADAAATGTGQFVSQSFLLTDTSALVLVMTVRCKEGSEPNAVEGGILAVENAVLVRHDEAAGLVVSEASDMSVFNPQRRHIRGATEELVAWSQGANYIISRLNGRAKELMEGRPN